MGSMEARVDLDAVEGLGAALQVRAFLSEMCGMEPGDGPSGGADVNVLRLAGRNLLHLCFDAS